MKCVVYIRRACWLLGCVFTYLDHAVRCMQCRCCRVRVEVHRRTVVEIFANPNKLQQQQQQSVLNATSVVVIRSRSTERERERATTAAAVVFYQSFVCLMLADRRTLMMQQLCMFVSYLHYFCNNFVSALLLFLSRCFLFRINGVKGWLEACWGRILQYDIYLLLQLHGVLPLVFISARVPTTYGVAVFL